MKKVFLIISIALTLFVISCNKNKVAIKKLEGAWTLMKENGSEVNTFYLIEFEKCKQNNPGYCDGTITTLDGGTQSIFYRILENGETLIYTTTITLNNFSIEYEVSRKILVLTETNLILEFDYDNIIIIREFEKK